jgi:hypothetical protein
LTVNGVKDQASGSRFSGQSGNTPWYTNRFAGFFTSGAHWTWEKFTAPLTAPYQRCFAFDAMQECEPYGEPEPLTLLEVAGEIPVGKALGAAGAGLKAAGIISLVAKSAAKSAAAGSEAFSYTFSKYLSSITKNGLRQGSYATRSGTLSPLQAQIELALPANRGLPDALLRIDLAGMRAAGYKTPGLTRVSSRFGLPGGGYEMQFPYPVPPQFITVVP